MLKRHSDNLKEDKKARKYCSKFFEDRLNLKPIFLNSATSGIYLFFKSLKLKNTDEVIIQDYTHPACKNVLHTLGKGWISCKNKNLNIDVEDAISKVTPNTRVIVYTLLNGFVSSDILRLRDYCTLHNILLLEDAAPGLGASVNNQLCGTIGDAAVFSFNTTKLIALGGGGCLVTKNNNIYKYVEEHNNLNFSKNNDFESLSLHFPWFMWNALQEQLELFDELVENRIKIHNKLKEALPYILSTDSNKCYSAGSILLPPEMLINKNKLIKLFKENNIQIRESIYYHTFEKHIYNSHIDIPFHKDLTDENIELFIRIFKEANIR